MVVGIKGVPTSARGVMKKDLGSVLEATRYLYKRWTPPVRRFNQNNIALPESRLEAWEEAREMLREMSEVCKYLSDYAEAEYENLKGQMEHGS